MRDIIVRQRKTPSTDGYTSIVNMVEMAMVNPRGVIRRAAGAYQIYSAILIEYRRCAVRDGDSGQPE